MALENEQNFMLFIWDTFGQYELSIIALHGNRERNAHNKML